ncbi:MAG: hypothetical protein ACRENE_20980 [Polyangiaceae bacterium]
MSFSDPTAAAHAESCAGDALPRSVAAYEGARSATSVHTSRYQSWGGSWKKDAWADAQSAGCHGAVRLHMPCGTPVSSAQVPGKCWERRSSYVAISSYDMSIERVGGPAQGPVPASANVP